MREASALRLYADESGNTGPDLMAGSQPLGVTAMVLLGADQERGIATAVADAAAKARHALPRELKFWRLAKKTQGRRVLQDMMRALRDNGARVFFSLTEKRYLAASFIVETFLDPLWTDGAPVEMLAALERRRAANLVYQVSDDGLLHQFLSACRLADRGLLVAAGERVARRLEVHPAEEAPQLAKALLRGLQDPFDWCMREDAPTRSNRPTPHTFTFLSLLSAVDRYLGATGDVAQLVSDEDAQFGAVLAEAFRLGQRSELFPGGISAYGTPGPITHVLARTEGHSHAEIGIQVADLVAGMVGAAARADVEGTDFADLGAAWMVLREVLADTALSHFWQVSERMLASVSRSFDGLVPPRDEWWWSRM